MRRFLSCALVTMGLAVAVKASATDLTISTDRPGILYGTAIVPAGHLQLEAGWPTWQLDDSDGERETQVATPTFLRFGISDTFELQIAESPFNHVIARTGADENSATGAGDMQIGAKWLLRNGDAHGPALVLVGYVSAPTGSAAFTAGGPAYNLNLVGAWSLDANTSFSAMASYTRAPEPGDGHADSSIAAINFSRSFNERVGGYLEAGWFPGFHDVQATALAGAGMTFLIGRRVQLDGFFDRGLNRASPDWMLGIGTSVLF